MLTKREKQVLELLDLGYTNSEIAENLNISRTTVIFHRKNIKIKLHAKNSCELVLNGIKMGLISIKPLNYER